MCRPDRGFLREPHNTMFKNRVDFMHRTVRDFLLGQKVQDLLACRTQRPFDVRAYLCRALLAQIKLIASLMPNHGMRALDMVDHRSHLLPDLTRTLDILINEVSHHVHEIEKTRGNTESSILDEIERVVLTRNKFSPNSPPTGLEIEYRKAFQT